MYSFLSTTEYVEQKSLKENLERALEASRSLEQEIYKMIVVLRKKTQKIFSVERMYLPSNTRTFINSPRIIDLRDAQIALGTRLRFLEQTIIGERVPILRSLDAEPTFLDSQPPFILKREHLENEAISRA